MTKCFIIDDEQPAIDVIQNYIKRIPSLELVGASTNPMQAIEIIRKNKADLVFLDIQMDEMNGIELAKKLDQNAKVIFCTAYSRFAVASFDLDAIDYLVKPFSFQRFERAVKRAIGAIKHPDQSAAEKKDDTDYFFIKTGQKGKMVRLDLGDIDFIEARNNRVVFHVAEKLIRSSHTLRRLEALLPKDSFIRVHKSYIVHIQKIALIQHEELRLRSLEQPIPIGPNFKAFFLNHLHVQSAH